MAEVEGSSPSAPMFIRRSRMNRYAEAKHGHFISEIRFAKSIPARRRNPPQILATNNEMTYNYFTYEL